MNSIVKDISLKRTNRYIKKLELLKKKEQNIELKTISIQTDEIIHEKKEIKLQSDSFDINIKSDDNQNIYKTKYYSFLLNLKNIKFSTDKDNKNTIGKIHKLENELKLNFSIMNNSEIIFFENDEIVYKILIQREYITFNYLKDNIIKKVKKSFILDFLLLKKNNKIFSKLNNEVILLVKGNINYYFIKKIF